MKGIRKKLAGFLAFAMVLGLFAPGMTTTVKAEEPAKLVMQVDLLNELITINTSFSGAESIKYVALKNAGVKVKEDHKSLDKSETELKIKATDWEIADTEVVDISWVSKTKTSAILFKAVDKDDKVLAYTVVNLNAQDKNFKVGFVSAQDKPANDKAKELGSNKDKVTVSGSAVVGDPDLGYFYFYTKNDKGNNTVIDPKIVDWKKGTSSRWTAVDDNSGESQPTDLANNLQLFKVKGATLSFRYCDGVVVQSAGDPYNVTAAWPSKEVKYSFKKQAAAPKVTIDYVKGTVSLKAGQEYMLEDVTSPSDDWISVDLYGEKDSKGKVKVPTLLLSDLASKANASGTAIDTSKKLTDNDIYRGNLVLKVRTAATSKAIPSKVATVQLKEENLAATEASIKATLSTASPAATVTVGYKIKTNAKSGLVVTRTDTTGDVYEFTYAASAGAINATTKWTKLPLAKSGKDAVVPVKLANGESIATSSSIFIRIAGNKASKNAVGKLYSPCTEVKLADLKELEKEVTVGTVKKDAKAEVSGVKDNTITVTVKKGDVSGTAIKVEEIPLTVKNTTTTTVKVDTTNSVKGDFNYTLTPAKALDKDTVKVALEINPEKLTTPKGGSLVIKVDGDVTITIKVVVAE